MTLEEILQMLGSKHPFKKDGSLSKSGEKAYNNLERLLNDSNNLIDRNDIIYPTDIMNEVDWIIEFG